MDSITSSRKTLEYAKRVVDVVVQQVCADAVEQHECVVDIPSSQTAMFSASSPIMVNPQAHDVSAAMDKEFPPLSVVQNSVVKNSKKKGKNVPKARDKAKVGFGSSTNSFAVLSTDAPSGR
ncbi:hypothetical protein V6N11_072394 [Hibiscus sabdariffa]|uniref:Uncharacterized protein n=1 Tax=Hibiscus sabdariffa TaxID=183260 RepID=A0ABR2U3M0_9ROSI